MLTHFTFDYLAIIERENQLKSCFCTEWMLAKAQKMSVINEASSVSSWYADQHILVTGATGFMGKILVEKLLRCCPKVSKIYLLVRVKRGMEPHERLEEYVKSPVSMPTGTARVVFVTKLLFRFSKPFVAIPIT